MQCELRLWRELHEPETADRELAARRGAERAAGSRARAELRALAAALFPDAAGAEFDPARTAALAADPAVRAIRDAAFESGGVAGRADFLVREAGGFGLRRVSAVLRPGEIQLDELAFAHFAAGRAGLAVTSVALLHLDPDFVRGAEPPSARELLRHSDVTRETAPLSRDLAARVAAQIALAAAPAPPAVEPSPHCRRPETCPFLPRCTAALPPDWIGHLPGLRPQHFAALRELGVARAGEVPADFPLTPAQRNAVASLARGAPFAASELAAALAVCAAGADFLDFEAIVPAVPLYPGTRAYEPVPFQWSAHLHRAGAEPAHAEFLAEAGADPRRGFAESLLAAFAGRALPVAVYSGFESDVLAAQARALPDLAAGLEALRARLFDLLPVLRRSVYHPGFAGSFSLKRVAPVLAPGFGFADLPGIADGGAASRAWHALARGELAPAAAARALAELRAYCARDSLALARLLDALRALAAHSSP